MLAGSRRAAAAGAAAADALLCAASRSPLSSPDTILAIIILCVYAGDVGLNFFVAFYQDGELVTQLPAIAAHYGRWRLWVDLVIARAAPRPPSRSCERSAAAHYMLAAARGPILSSKTPHGIPWGPHRPRAPRWLRCTCAIAAMQLTTVPFDWIVLGAMGLQQSNSTTAWCAHA